MMVAGTQQLHSCAPKSPSAIYASVKVSVNVLLRTVDDRGPMWLRGHRTRSPCVVYKLAIATDLLCRYTGHSGTFTLTSRLGARGIEVTTSSRSSVGRNRRGASANVQRHPVQTFVRLVRHSVGTP
jgi:hypothetical protein